MSGACSTHRSDKKCINLLVGKPEGKGPRGTPVVDGKIMLKWILGKLGEKVWTGSI
jgi:hypothetical protein